MLLLQTTHGMSGLITTFSQSAKGHEIEQRAKRSNPLARTKNITMVFKSACKSRQQSH